MGDRVRRKWSDSLLTEGFVPFPKTLLRTLLSVFTEEHALEDLVTVLAIVDCLGVNEKDNSVSLDYIAFIADEEPTVMERRLRRLKKQKYATWSHPISARTDVYQFDLTPLFKRIELQLEAQENERDEEVDPSDIPF